MSLDEFFSIVERVLADQAQLAKLRRAIGPYPYRTQLIRDSAGKDLSEEMTLILALVVYDGYELFPAHDLAGK